MRSALTNTLVANLKPFDKPYEIRDARLKGLLLRVQPSGVMTYYVEYARGKRMKLGRTSVVTPSQARDEAKKVLGDVYQGGDPATERQKRKAKTFGGFIDTVYAPWARENIRTAEPTIQRLKARFADFQNKKLGEITPWLVEKWRMNRLKSGIKPTTVNRDLDDLKSSLAKAVDWGFIDTHPIASVKRSRVDRSATVRFLSPEEDARLRQALDDRESRIRAERANANAWRRERGYPPRPDLDQVPFADRLKPMVLIALNTGIRQGELFSLTWTDIDLERANLTIHGAKAKSGGTRHVPLNDEALSTFRSWQSGGLTSDVLVFPGKYGERLNNVRQSWLATLKAARIAGFRWHDMRHTFASRLVMAGVDLNTVRELLGHSTYQMTLRYSHLAPEHKAAAVAKLMAPPPTAMPNREVI